MYRIRTYNNIARKGLAIIEGEHYQTGAEIDNADALLLRSHKLESGEIDDNVLAVARAGAGTNNVPVPHCNEHGIAVFNTPGANANAVKELVLAGLLLGSRGILPGVNYVDSLKEMADNTALSSLLEKEKKRFKGNELAGRTIGIVGLGAIGSLVAEAAIHLGMEVLGHDPKLSVDAAWRLPNQVRKIENLSALLANSDYVTLHLPAIEPTIGLINDEALAVMKPGACLLNFSRDEIVDPDAILAALNADSLRLYISDFPRHELIGRDDTILMPHIGASTGEAEENCAVMAARQLKDFLEDGNIRNSVNFPATHLDRIPDSQPDTRLAITNRNVPGMLGQILSVLAERGLNVVDMINKSRDELAYNLIDLDAAPDQNTLEQIRAIEDVICARRL
ncbi:MAG: phosphoglycerate dehydrogenase [Pseudohongiellaceae bacterium]